jgi:anthranilate synthase component I
MQIISELEGTTCGPYAGCVGYFSFNGNLDTCTTICFRVAWKVTGGPVA